MDMETIEQRTKAYAEARAELADEVAQVTAATNAVKKKHLPQIRKKIAKASNAKAELAAALEEAPELFKRPKSRILHGIKVGWVKAKGKVFYTDGKRVVALIRRHFDDRFDDLVKVTETPKKTALSTLSGTELKKLGVSVGEDTDVVLIKGAESEIDKFVDTLIGNPKEMEEGDD